MVEEKDLYRIFTIHKGSNAGDYKLYFNRTVAQHYLPENIHIYKWGEVECMSAQPGDYIEAYDGAVVMLMNVRPYVSKQNKVPFWFFRFPMCMIRAYRLRNGTYKFGEFYAQMTYLNKNRLVSTMRYGTDNMKIRFATLIVAGVHPIKAYRLAFGANWITSLDIRSLNKRINNIMKDEVVKAEILQQIQPLVDKLGDKFSDERLVQELDLMLSNSRKGSDAHRENIKFIMALLNKLPDNMYSKGNSKKDRAINADFTEVSPPALGIHPAPPVDL